MCKLWRDEEIRYIETLLSNEMVMDPGVRNEIVRSRGFCNRHMHEIVKVAETPGRTEDGVGFVMFMTDAVEMLDKDLDEDLALIDESQTTENVLRKLSRRSLDRRASCPVCSWISRIHRIHCEPFFELLHNEEYRVWYETGPGLCMPHFQFVLQIADFTEVARSSLKTVFLAQKRKMREVLGLCNEYIRKSRWNSRNEPRGAEATVKDLILIKIAGLEGLNLMQCVECGSGRSKD